MAKTQKQRAKNLDDNAIEGIVGILDGWSEKLTWEALIETIQARCRVQYTRQALHQHERIKQAFRVTKDRLSSAPVSLKSFPLSGLEVQALTERFKRLEAENSRLKLENERLLEQFVVWAYNAHIRGLDLEFLNRPLPHVDRDQTRK